MMIKNVNNNGADKNVKKMYADQNVRNDMLIKTVKKLYADQK